ncbi:MAG: formylglycine-generating enzyme family protein, partial [Deltaproteobacteria bacterium]|nr:formylglycine-generating enzyme family protein [Deltaproteobacteria bacterium]
MKKSRIFCLALFVLLCVGIPASSFAAKSSTPPRQDPQTYTNSIGMEFVLIPAGSFTRTFTTKNDAGEEQKQFSKVIISKPFYLGIRQVTQEQWAAVMGKNPSSFKGQNNPVDTVSWDDAQEFIKRLNAKEKHMRYRLPTEAEWDLAVRGGMETPFFFLKDARDWERAADELEAYAWFKKNSGDTTHPVGQKKANSYGLHDMYGNAWEWVQDGFAELP